MANYLFSKSHFLPSCKYQGRRRGCSVLSLFLRFSVGMRDRNTAFRESQDAKFFNKSRKTKSNILFHEKIGDSMVIILEWLW